MSLVRSGAMLDRRMVAVLVAILLMVVLVAAFVTVTGGIGGIDPGSDAQQLARAGWSHNHTHSPMI